MKTLRLIIDNTMTDVDTELPPGSYMITFVLALNALPNPGDTAGDLRVYLDTTMVVRAALPDGTVPLAYPGGWARPITVHSVERSLVLTLGNTAGVWTGTFSGDLVLCYEAI